MDLSPYSFIASALGANILFNVCSHSVPFLRRKGRIHKYLKHGKFQNFEYFRPGLFYIGYEKFIGKC
jgi:hypothetical protein